MTTGERWLVPHFPFALAQEKCGTNLLSQVGMRKGHHSGLDDIRVGQQSLLDMHTRDILSAPNDDILRATNDIEVALRIKAAKVARGDPAFYIGGSRRFAPVAAHRGRRPCKNLPDTIYIRVLDPHFDDRQWSPDASRPLLHLRASARGEDTARFRQTVQCPAAATHARKGGAHPVSEFARNNGTAHRHSDESRRVIAGEVFVIDDARYHGSDAARHAHALSFDRAEWFDRLARHIVQD